ncbi:MAG: hypothetical protein U0132_02595 [Gemmatimonadaceae bacterium]
MSPEAPLNQTAPTIMKETLLSADGVEGRRLPRLLVTGALATAMAAVRLWSMDAPAWYFLTVLTIGLAVTAAVFWWRRGHPSAASRVSIVGRNLYVQERQRTESIPLHSIRMVEVVGPTDGECRLIVSLVDREDAPTRPPITFVPNAPDGDRSAAQSVATMLRREVAEARREASPSPVSSHSPTRSRVVR